VVFLNVRTPLSSKVLSYYVYRLGLCRFSVEDAIACSKVFFNDVPKFC